MQQTCTNCNTDFEVTDTDLAYYDRVSPVFGGKKFIIPPPTHCPHCRQQRRLTFRNERKLYQRKCDLCGSSIISIYSADKANIIYCQKCWWSDGWDPLDYGKEFNFTKPFFEQFGDLMGRVPLIALIATNNENSTYVNLEMDSKNCYMNVGGHYNQDCYYNTYCLNGRNCVDNYWVLKCELLYGSVSCGHCYHSAFLAHCGDCSNCSYGYDLQGCEHCIGCVGLRKKKRHAFNEPCSDEDVQEWRRKLESNSGKEEVMQRFQELLLAFPRKYAMIKQSEGCTGDYITNSKDCQHCFESEKDRDNTYTTITIEVQDSHDLNSVGWSERIYEVVAATHLQGVAFSSTFLHGFDSLYCFLAFNSSNLFGCVGLNHKQHCIFNKQYSKEEYEELVPKIIEHMLQSKEFGEFFPVQLSPFAYNETVAQEYFPLSKKEALAKGYKWRDEVDDIPDVEKTIPAKKLPETIDDVPDDVLNWVIQCQETGRPYRIIKQELAYYRKHKLPVPHFHPDERHRRRMALRNPRKLWKRECMKCNKEIETTYTPERPEKVYCEECYLKEVY